MQVLCSQCSAGKRYPPQGAVRRGGLSHGEIVRKASDWLGELEIIPRGGGMVSCSPPATEVPRPPTHRYGENVCKELPLSVMLDSSWQVQVRIKAPRGICLGSRLRRIEPSGCSLRKSARRAERFKSAGWRRRTGSRFQQRGLRSFRSFAEGRGLKKVPGTTEAA